MLVKYTLMKKKLVRVPHFLMITVQCSVTYI